MLSSFLLLAQFAFQAMAFSEHENLNYVEKILSLLNDEKMCLLPTYEEVNNLQRSLSELEAAWGSEADAKLSNDQKLVKRTLLDQWTSFQRYLNAETVTKPAKKRAFLGKVDSYQKQKRGFSICRENSNERNQEEHEDIEKSPLVRYGKKLKFNEGQPLKARPVSSLAYAGLGGNSRRGTKPKPSKSKSTKPILENADVQLKFQGPPTKKGDVDQRPRQCAGKSSLHANERPRKIMLQIGDRK